MAIKINTGQVKSSKIDKITGGFNPNPEAASMVAKTSAQAFKSIAGSLSQLQAKNKRDERIRDTTVINNAQSNYNIGLEEAYDNYLDVRNSGDSDKINQAKAQYDAFSPQKGINWSEYSDGEVSDSTLWESSGVMNNVREKYSKMSLNLENELVAQDNLNTIKAQQATTRATLTDVTVKYADALIPDLEFDQTIDAIKNYYQLPELVTLRSNDNRNKYLRDGEALLSGLFAHQLSLTTNIPQKKALAKKWGETLKDEAFQNVSTQAFKSFPTAVSKDIKGHKTKIETEIKTGAVASLSQNEALAKELVSSDVLFPPDQESATLVYNGITDLIDLHESNAGVSSIYTGPQLKKAQSIKSLLTTIIDDDDGRSILDDYIISEVNKRKYIDNYKVSDRVPDILATATPEIKEEFRKVRDGVAQTISQDLKKGDTRSLAYITNDRTAQRQLLDDMGYSNLSLYNAPITDKKYTLGNTRIAVDDNIEYVNAAITQNDLKSLSMHAYSLVNNPQSPEDYELGLVLMAASSQKDKTAALQNTQAFVVTLGRYNEDAAAYASMKNGSTQLQEVVNIVEGFSKQRESFVDLQIEYFQRSGNTTAEAFYEKIQQAAIAQVIKEAYANADESTPWWSFVLPSNLEEGNKEKFLKHIGAKQFFNADTDKIDSELERMLVTNPANEIIARIGFYGYSEDGNIPVYMPPNIFGKAVNTVLQGRSRGYQMLFGDTDFQLPFDINIEDPFQTVAQTISVVGTGDFTATLEQTQDALVDVNTLALATNENFDVAKIFSPTFVEKQKALATPGRRQFSELVAKQNIKFEELQKDPEALAEVLASLQIETTIGTRPAFDFSNQTRDSFGNLVTSVFYYDPVTKRTEPLNYVAGTTEDGKPIIKNFTIAVSKQSELLDEYGIGAFRKKDDPNIISTLPAAAAIETEFRENVRRKKNFSNKKNK